MGNGQVETESAGATMDVHRAELAGRLILLAEDNETNQIVMTMQLSNLGYTTMLAADGSEAIALWKRHSFAMILTDCSMPAVDGFKLASTIRKAEQLSGEHTPIIAITANAVANNRIQCIESGMDDCIFTGGAAVGLCFQHLCGCNSIRAEGDNFSTFFIFGLFLLEDRHHI